MSKLLYDNLQQMPVVTVEQVVRFREAALKALCTAYEHGWHEAINWSGEDHLHADTDSPAYLAERAKRVGI